MVVIGRSAKLQKKKMTRQSADVDILFDIKNSFYIGNYQQAINEAQRIKPSTPELQLERDCFLYRSYIAQKKYMVVLDDISNSSPSELRLLKTLGEYFNNKNKRNSIVNCIDEQLNSGNFDNNHMGAVVAATIYCYEKNLESALRALHTDDHIESMAINLQIYVRMDRVDLAKKELKNMQDKDEDNTLTQLAQAWLNIAMGGDKLQDAYYIFQELIDKYGSSAVLLNGQAVTFIGQSKFEEAESALQEAMDKDSNNTDTLLNMMVLSQHLSRPIEVSNRYRSQLIESPAEHPFVSDYNTKLAEFDRLALQYTIA